ncbi:pyridoxal 5'-phosphate synthase [Burkholderia sp. LMG 32019]|uniref:pyridoxal 5'-phosphate synthase n=1 Tax=Burkholderia sp. LMG 32019 TaxID=3158173 RepID=UPI003C2E1C1D
MNQRLDTPASQPDGAIFQDPPHEPIPVLRAWLDSARASGVLEPGAMALATTGAEGHASTRMVQVLDVGPDGLLFTTHAGSQKGREIAAFGWASGVLYWRETKQQIVVSGPIGSISIEASDALWAKRSPVTYPMSSVSLQSETLDDEQALRAKAQRLVDAGMPFPRPVGWLGYALRPTIIEFWQASPDQLHNRLRYDATANGWTSRRLQP